MKINCISPNQNQNFSGLKNWLTKFRPTQIQQLKKTANHSGPVMKREAGVTIGLNPTSDGGAMKIVGYPAYWPNMDIAYTESMAKRVDKNLVGLRMTVPLSYTKKHPEVATEDGAIEFAKMMREMGDAIWGTGSESKMSREAALDKVAELMGIDGPYKAYINVPM